MKAIINFTALFVAVSVLFSCGGSKPEKSIENLKAAITGETNASATYQAFSAKAAEEGYPNIAKMFAAASAAEAIHVKNHNTVLTKLGQEVFTVTPGTPNVAATAENIQAAVDGETYEYTVMYPGFIALANVEKCDDAITSFTWASDAEAVHARLYSQALNTLKATESDETVAPVWHVCPKCGDLFSAIEGDDGCPFCASKSSSFLKF
jgi:rubrerythrin